MKSQLRVMACVVAALASGVATAAVTTNPGSGAGTQSTGGQVHFTGEITENSCNISSGSTGQTVDLGKWAKAYFTGGVTETTKTPFSISVDSCPQSVKTVSVLFDGKKDTSVSSLLALDTASGSATGVGIQMYEDDLSTAITLGTVTKAQQVTAGSGTTGGTATLKFYADYKINNTTIAAGPANGVADFNMVYN